MTPSRDDPAALLGPPAVAQPAWRLLYTTFLENCQALSAAMTANLSEEEVFQLVTSLLIPIARHALAGEQRRVRFFEAAQAMGVHFLPAHPLVSPVPDTARVPEQSWLNPLAAAMVTGAFQLADQVTWFESLSPYFRDLASVSEEMRDPAEYHWRNPAFSPLDACLYYSMIRALRPARIVEVGGGYSTKIAARAAIANESGRLVCVEPFPSEALSAGFPGLDRLVSQKVQDVPLELFGDLEPNDILFIDSTHLASVGSDVNHVFFEILPRLKDGVVVHFHDIFLPWNYPENWVKEKGIYWNEQYLLLALLFANPRIRILGGSYYLSRTAAGLLRERISVLPLVNAVGGCSFWVQWRGRRD